MEGSFSGLVEKKPNQNKLTLHLLVFHICPAAIMFTCCLLVKAVSA